MQEETEILNNAIFDNVDHLLIVTDKNGVIKKFNKAAENFLGYRAEELINLQSPAIFHLGSEVVERSVIFSKELNRKIEPGFEVFVAKTNLGLPNEHEWTYIAKNGTHKPVLLSVTAVRDTKDDIIGYIGVAKDISASKRIAEDLQISQNRLKEAQRIARIGSWSLDLQTNTLLWSDQIYVIFEIDPVMFEPSYEGFLSSIHPDDVDMVNLAFNNSLQDKAPYNIEHRLLMKDGRIKYVIERGETIYSSSGEPLLTQGTVQDITQLKLTQIDLIQAKENAENSNKAKSRFLANMSHEIRTPLNGIMGFIELLQNDETDPKKSDYLNIIHTSSKSLQVVINDILDLSKIEDGSMKIETIDFNLEQHLHGLVSFFTSIAATKKILIHFEYPNELSQHVHTDPLRLKQILSNLISNAIKFSKENSNITLTLHRKGNRLHISVIDKGIGISKEAQERIFNPFEQAELSTTRSYGGTGLGLSISKKTDRTFTRSNQGRKYPWKRHYFFFLHRGTRSNTNRG
ncbi:PAS domain-containing sensor histidine kinase [Campylobacterota bacterium]